MKILRDPLLGLISRLPRWLVVLIGVVLMALVGWSNYVTGTEVELFIFYLFPILFVTWFGSRRLGEVLGVVASLHSAWIEHLLISESRLGLVAWNFAARAIFFVLLVALASRLRHLLEHEAALSNTDPLTDISNRRFFNQSLETELGRARRYRHPLSLVYIDIDDFKSVNDNAGHGTGDELLKGVADVLRQTVRKVDIPARIGGDEFVVILPELDHDHAKEFVERLSDALTTAARHHGWPVTFSKGLVTFSQPPESREAILEQADAAMYSAKSSGKNRTVCLHLDAS